LCNDSAQCSFGCEASTRPSDWGELLKDTLAFGVETNLRADKAEEGAQVIKALDMLHAPSDAPVSEVKRHASNKAVDRVPKGTESLRAAVSTAKEANPTLSAANNSPTSVKRKQTTNNNLTDMDRGRATAPDPVQSRDK